MGKKISFYNNNGIFSAEVERSRYPWRDEPVKLENYRDLGMLIDTLFPILDLENAMYYPEFHGSMVYNGHDYTEYIHSNVKRENNDFSRSLKQKLSAVGKHTDTENKLLAMHEISPLSLPVGGYESEPTDLQNPDHTDALDALEKNDSKYKVSERLNPLCEVGEKLKIASVRSLPGIEKFKALSIDPRRGKTPEFIRQYISRSMDEDTYKWISNSKIVDMR